MVNTGLEPSKTTCIHWTLVWNFGDFKAAWAGPIGMAAIGSWQRPRRHNKLLKNKKHIKN